MNPKKQSPRPPSGPATPPTAGGADERKPATSSFSSSRRQKAWVPRGTSHERSSECQKERPCSSSPSVSSEKIPLQTVTPVQPPKSADSELQMVTAPPRTHMNPKKQSPRPPSGPATPPMAGGDDERKQATSSSSSRRQKAWVPRGTGQERSSECQKEGVWSSSPSVSTNKVPQKMVAPVQPPKSLSHQLVASLQLSESVDSRGHERSSECQKEGQCSSSPYVCGKKSPLQMVIPVQPPKSLDTSIPMVASGKSKESDSGAGPFDICMDNSNGCFKLKRSLIDINREKRRANRVAPPFQRLRPGMVLLKNFLKIDDQVKIILHCRRLGVGTGGFYTPGYRDGATLNLRMMCLGKNWDPDSTSYGDERPFDGAQPPKIPEVLANYVNDALEASHKFLKQEGGEAELPRMSPDICIVNFYTDTGRLGLHQDKDESKASLSEGLPVVSFSLGNAAEFLYGDERDDAKASKVDLESGDVLIFGGQSRHIFHGVSKIKPKTAPEPLTVKTNLQPGRLNLTFRQYDISK